MRLTVSRHEVHFTTHIASLCESHCAVRVCVQGADILEGHRIINPVPPIMATFISV